MFIKLIVHPSLAWRLSSSTINKGTRNCFYLDARHQSAKRKKTLPPYTRNGAMITRTWHPLVRLAYYRKRIFCKGPKLQQEASVNYFGKNAQRKSDVWTHIETRSFVTGTSHNALPPHTSQRCSLGEYPAVGYEHQPGHILHQEPGR